MKKSAFVSVFVPALVALTSLNAVAHTSMDPLLTCSGNGAATLLMLHATEPGTLAFSPTVRRDGSTCDYLVATDTTAQEVHDALLQVRRTGPVLLVASEDTAETALNYARQFFQPVDRLVLIQSDAPASLKTAWKGNGRVDVTVLQPQDFTHPYNLQKVTVSRGVLKPGEVFLPEEVFTTQDDPYQLLNDASMGTLRTWKMAGILPQVGMLNPASSLHAQV